MYRRKDSMPMNDNFTDVAIDATVASAATKWGMGGGAAASMYGWLTSNSSVAFIGIVVTILGFAINFAFQRRREVREIAEATFRQKLTLAEEARREELHQAQLAALREKNHT